MVSLKTEFIASRDLTVTKDGISELLSYRVEGTNNTRVVYNNLNALGFGMNQTHPIYGGLAILTQNHVIQDPDAPKNFCLLDVTYSPPETSDRDFNANNEAWEFDMVAKQVKINAVKKQADVEQWNGDGLIAVGNRDTAIGRNGDRVEGASVYRPFGAARCTKRYPSKASLGLAERQAIYALQGKVCNAPFIDWGVNECLCLGANISYPGDTTAEATYQFLFGIGQQNVDVDVFYTGGGGAIMTPVTIPQLDPFNILAFNMGQRVDKTKINTVVTGPVQVGRFKVYEQDNFAILGLVGP